VAATPTPITAATEQQHHDNNNQDQFHRNSPLTPTGIRWAPKKQRRLKAIVPDKPVGVAQPSSCDVSNFARAHRRSTAFSVGGFRSVNRRASVTVRKPPLIEEPRFVCSACGKRGADVRPDFNWNKNLAAVMGYR
jgi:hypothetical protein